MNGKDSKTRHCECVLIFDMPWIWARSCYIMQPTAVSFFDERRELHLMKFINNKVILNGHYNQLNTPGEPRSWLSSQTLRCCRTVRFMRALIFGKHLQKTQQLLMWIKIQFQSLYWNIKRHIAWQGCEDCSDVLTLSMQVYLSRPSPIVLYPFQT